MKLKIFITALFAAACITADAQPVKNQGHLKVEGTKLVNKNGEPVVLHGMSFGWHNLWPRFYNEGAVHELVTKWNCTVVRASMGIQLNDSGFLKSPAASIALMKNVINACIKEGVYVIIDWHDHNIHLEEALSFFEGMAREYSRYPNIMYEVFNEPDYESWADVKKYSEEVIKTIRKYDSSNIILVGSPRWDQDIHLPAADPVRGYNNLMYTMHFYAGTHKQWLRDRTDEAVKKGLPVFISECAGMEATGDGPIDYLEWQKWVDWMDTKGLSWVAWSVSDKNETCSVLKPAAAAGGGWKDDVIKEYGISVRKYLQSYSGK